MTDSSDVRVVAAIDLGSNSFHMIVCRVTKGELIVQDRIKEMVRLAAGIDEQRNLSEEAQRRALECLTRFSQRLVFALGDVNLLAGCP